MIELTHKFTPHSRLMEGLVAQGARAVEEELFQIEDDVVNEIRSIILSEMNPREGDRSKGAEHLADTIEAQVTSRPGEFPVTLSVWSTEPDQGKVGALEFGAGGHGIDGNPFLYFPSNRISRGSGQGRGVFGRKFQASGQGKNFASFNAPRGVGSRGGKGKQLTKVQHVDHPGNPAYHFMHRALQAVVRRRLGG